MLLGYATKEFCVIIKYQGYNKSVFTDTYPVYLPGSRVKFCFQKDIAPG